MLCNKIRRILIVGHDTEDDEDVYYDDYDTFGEEF